MADFLENMFGMQVTNPDLMDWSQAWDRAFETYISDPAMSDWLSENSPHAYQSMTARMLEAVRKGYWDPSDEVMKTLVSEYAESVIVNGPACCHHTCGNPVLDDYVSGIISAPGVVSSETASEYRKTMDEVAGVTSAPSQPSSRSSSGGNNGDGTYPPGWFDEPDETEQTVPPTSVTNETTKTEGGVGTDVSQPAEPVKESESSKPSDYVEGQEMTVEKADKSTGLSFSGAPMIGMILVIVLVAVIYWGYRRRG